MTVENDVQDAEAGREPGEGECGLCGSAPATLLTQQGLASLLIFFRLSTWKGWACRDCAEAVHADADARTMTWAWWGVGGFMAWAFLLGNRARMRKARALDVPRSTPGVTAAMAAPVVDVQPWYRRRAPLVAACVGVTVWVLLAAFFVLALTLPE
ncbi:hypothetical protein DNL40_13490 [Xylanimonas oleitrophica]|uniref:Uncharacterized protein n=1 Tax=Xylanimonas oleitrophica TaxID=2607479 RepID=A0A2W5WL76_9MICO|nr:hypothetical protein [Xylanimonas oleitrophica]PZR52027.1 hypothetical protein DNL40_13490 [Xylanimonas oleitrophica]